jgi:putative toxin-antitoxin system antitoxin component (TIGR02293 family)
MVSAIAACAQTSYYFGSKEFSMPKKEGEARARTAARGKRASRKITLKFDASQAVKAGGYRVIQQTPPEAIVLAIRTGVRARFLKQMAGDMAVSQERLYETLGLARATLVRKAKEDKLMSSAESERALGLARLIGQAEEMVSRSGDPDGFDAARWIAGWLQQPNPALGGKRPEQWMDTAVGRELVSETLARLETGAYA